MKIFLGAIATISVLLAAGWACAPSQTVTTELHLDATPDDVWAVLSDFDAYGDWNPFLPAIVGEMEVGETLTISFASKAFGHMEIAPTILAVNVAEEFRWKGILFVPGIFDGEHFFKLEPHEGGTRLVHGERFSGLLLWALDMNVMKDDFNAMNEGVANEVSRRG